jgi:hypothetical protein
MKVELRSYCCMNEKLDHDTNPTDKPKITGSGAKPPETSPHGARDIDPLCALAVEILNLPRSDENMARLRELRVAFDAEQLRQLNGFLETERRQSSLRRIEAEETLAKIMRPFDEARNRTDLTVPEMLFLAQLQRADTARLMKSAAEEKKQLVQKYKRKKGCRRGWI